MRDLKYRVGDLFKFNLDLFPDPDTAPGDAKDSMFEVIDLPHSTRPIYLLQEITPQPHRRNMVPGFGEEDLGKYMIQVDKNGNPV